MKKWILFFVLLLAVNSWGIDSQIYTSSEKTNVDTLTDDSMADVLHRHSELSASDGDPNVVVSVSESGNVGIGTTSPWTTLSAKSINSEATSGSFGWSGTQGRVDLGITGYQGRVDVYNSNNVLRSHIDSSGNSYFLAGNIGIGTASPTAALQVSGTNDNAPDASGVYLGMASSGVYASAELSGPDGSFIDFTSAGVDFDGRILYGNSNDTITFYTGAVVRASITPTGMGIGTTPQYPLHVSGGTEDYVIQATSTDAGSYIRLTDATKTGSIGEYAGQMVLMPDLTGGYTYRFSATDLRPSADNVVSLGAVGYDWTTVYTQNGTVSTSDERLKEKIKDVDPEKALQIVNALTPFLHHWKTTVQENEVTVPEVKDADGNIVTPESTTIERTERPDDAIHVAYSAQQVASVLEAIGYDPDQFAGVQHFALPETQTYLESDGTEKTITESWSIAYSELIPILGSAIQELTKLKGGQQAEIDQLKTDYAALAARVAALEVK